MTAPAVYLDGAERNVERLLGMMDRNRDSNTFGCFCRPFWHDKTMDFPSAHQQIGVLPLTLAYTQRWSGNPFHGHETVREYIDAAITFWTRIQHANGSFDEHYPNEHSLGAAAWTLWAVTETYMLLDDPPAIEPAIERTATFLARHDEPGDIANHQAVAASALVNTHRITGTGLSAARDRLAAVAEMQHRDGWFQEYVGADIGYQSTTVAHLARVHCRSPGIVDREVLDRALTFFSDFIDADGYYAGIIGSRNTRHIHPTGFEMLADEFDTARRIARSVRVNREAGTLLDPSTMDDKHFSCQLAEYLDSYRNAADFPDGDHSSVGPADYDDIAIRTDDGLLFVNVSKGGVYERYRDGRLIDRDTGITVERGGTTYTANWPGVTDTVRRGADAIEVEGALRKVPNGTLSGFTFLLFRLFNHTFGRFPNLSLAVKDHLISRLIGSGRGGERFRRTLTLSDRLVVEDEHGGDPVNGKTRTNFVPSSEFFARDQLDTLRTGG